MATLPELRIHGLSEALAIGAKPKKSYTTVCEDRGRRCYNRWCQAWLWIRKRSFPFP
jgi:hypothetical protein